MKYLDSRRFAYAFVIAVLLGTLLTLVPGCAVSTPTKTTEPTLAEILERDEVKHKDKAVPYRLRKRLNDTLLGASLTEETRFINNHHVEVIRRITAPFTTSVPSTKGQTFREGFKYAIRIELSEGRTESVLCLVNDNNVITKIFIGYSH